MSRFVLAFTHLLVSVQWIGGHHLSLLLLLGFVGGIILPHDLLLANGLGLLGPKVGKPGALLGPLPDVERFLRLVQTEA